MSPLFIDYHQRRTATPKPKPFTIAPAKVEDVRRFVDIEFHAFENERVNQLLSYRDYKKPAHFERSVKTYQKSLDNENLAHGGLPQSKKYRTKFQPAYPLPISTVSLKKIVDMETNEIVTFTKIEMKAYTLEELRQPYDIGHEGEPKMNRDWFGLNERLRRQYMGLDEHCCKSLKSTHPGYQHWLTNRIQI